MLIAEIARAARDLGISRRRDFRKEVRSDGLRLTPDPVIDCAARDLMASEMCDVLAENLCQITPRILV